MEPTQEGAGVRWRQCWQARLMRLSGVKSERVNNVVNRILGFGLRGQIVGLKLLVIALVLLCPVSID